MVASEWGIDGDLRILESEQDLVFRVKSSDGFALLRISNIDEDVRTVEFQLAALEWLGHGSLDFKVPCTIPTVDGKPWREVETSRGESHIFRMTTWIEGLPAAELDADPELYFDLGRTIAEMDQAFTGFIHPAADQEHPWVIMKVGRLRSLLEHVTDPEEYALLEAALSDFEGQVLPLVKQLPHQVIHQDAHPGNVILDPDGKINGIIDFGDLTFAPRVAGIAAAADIYPEMSISFLEALLAAASGYDLVTPLNEAEVTALPILQRTRMAMSAILGRTRRALDPHQPAYVIDATERTQALREYADMGAIGLENRLRERLRMPPANPGGPDLDLAERRLASMGGSPFFYRTPLHVERGDGVYLIGNDGRRYLDMYNNVPQVGHSNPHVAKAISRQAAVLNTNTRYLYRAAVEYAERITGTLPDHLSKVLFVNSGSEANDLAWQLATAFTGSSGAIVMEDAYHGITQATLALSPAARPSQPAHVDYLMSPDPYRGVIREGDLAVRYAADTDRALGALAERGHKPATFMVDTALCSNGVPAVPDGYFGMVAEKVRAAGGLIIADEVQAGFGRLGAMWGHQVHGMSADIVTLGKPVGNGYPLGVVITRSEILESQGEHHVFSTFGGNAVSAAAGMAVLDVIESQDLITRSRLVGDRLRSRIRDLADTHPLIGDVRGRGMLVGVEFVTNRVARTPATVEAAELTEILREHGVLVGLEGRDRNIFKLRPALIFADRHTDLFIEALDNALHQLRDKKFTGSDR